MANLERTRSAAAPWLLALGTGASGIDLERIHHSKQELIGVALAVDIMHR